MGDVDENKQPLGNHVYRYELAEDIEVEILIFWVFWVLLSSFAVYIVLFVDFQACFLSPNIETVVFLVR
jgi:hypothetical protein